MLSPMRNTARARSTVPSLIGLLACVCLAFLPSCDDPRAPCKSATPETFENGCAMTWQCHDGTFRVECSTAAGDPPEQCRCIQDAVEVGSFSMAGVCPADNTEFSEAGGDEANRRTIANNGCGWNVISSDASPDASPDP